MIILPRTYATVPEYKLCLEDGHSVTAGERRLLDKLRKQLGISENRAKEIENTLKNQ